ncbi:type II toxin-antitoxin system HicB family antitoxin [Mycobacterium sp. NPDC003449]
MPNHYTYRAEWSPEDDEYVGLVAEFPSLSWLAPTAAEAISGAERLVDDILTDMAQASETAPVPLTERRYSGNLSVRTSPAQHRQLAIEAAEQRVSINQWVVQKLAAVRPRQSAPTKVVHLTADDGEHFTLLNVSPRDTGAAAPLDDHAAAPED